MLSLNIQSLPFCQCAVSGYCWCCWGCGRSMIKLLLPPTSMMSMIPRRCESILLYPQPIFVIIADYVARNKEISNAFDDIRSFMFTTHYNERVCCGAWYNAVVGVLLFCYSTLHSHQGRQCRDTHETFSARQTLTSPLLRWVDDGCWSHFFPSAEEDVRTLGKTGGKTTTTKSRKW